MRLGVRLVRNIAPAALLSGVFCTTLFAGRNWVLGELKFQRATDVGKTSGV
jgi:hypothetical protein